MGREKGRHDPNEEFGYGDAKKKRISPVNYAEEKEEEEWEDEDVVVLSNEDLVAEDEKDEDILFEALG